MERINDEWKIACRNYGDFIDLVSYYLPGCLDMGQASCCLLILQAQSYAFVL